MPVRRLQPAIVLVLSALLMASCQPSSAPTPATVPSPSPPPVTPFRATPEQTVAASLPTDGVSPTDLASPSPVTGATGQPAAGWQKLEDFPAEQVVAVTSVAPFVSGFLAVGYEIAPGTGAFGPRNGVLWVSADGRSWTRSAPPAFQNATLIEVESFGDQLYVLGEICPDDVEGCERPADAGVTIWRSADAVDWQALPLPSSLREGEIDGSATGPARLAVRGASGTDLAGTVWISTDGQSWDERRDLGGLEAVDMLAAGGERLVAMEIRYLAEEDDVAMVAAYSDGAGFAAAQAPAATGAIIHGAAFGESGFVAVGQRYDAEGALSPAVWLSVDGAVWSEADTAGLPADVGLRDVVALHGGYLAIGSALEAGIGGREAGGSWFSPDGSSWQPAGELAGAAYDQITSSAAGEGGLVVFAVDFDEEQEDEPGASTIHVWFLPLDALLPP
jgi:hypothetical protein